ncbi:hypothetical protein QN277_020176 [Acacia crassicarpa]|uniref:Endonuclease/exonuclease/phosphatase domain-containing protein n=1 Tax=Acacia crassicarpa TaxID=499986 RepID=A0AAE1JMF4_9FABA|nr:hypothetical protein QN277_020176 [Acacia crassicarpa]
MIIASWNFRGAGGRSFPLTIKDIVSKYCIDILCLIEPRISGDRADRVCRKLGFSHWFRVESTGYSGGIWLMWDSALFDITYLTSTTQLLHCSIKEKATNSMSIVTIVYGETTCFGRIDLWNSIRLLKNSNSPWLVMGDFNIYLSPNDKLGGADPPWASMKHFKDCVDDSELIEAKIQGEKFTWERKGLKERLDWVFSNINWINCFSNFIVRHELKFKSDHRVVVVNSNPSSHRRNFRKNFSYQIAWALEDDFKDVTKEAWNDKNWLDGLQSFQKVALDWNDNRIGNFTKNKRELIQRLKGIDKSRKMNLQTGLYKLERKLWH